MTSKERAALRAKANTLDPIIQIGKEGITDNLITQIDDTLDVRELIKIRVHLETAPKTPKELANELAPALNAEVVQVIGGVIVLWREADEAALGDGGDIIKVLLHGTQAGTPSSGLLMPEILLKINPWDGQ
ncbi:MAG: ribosome assembly RNA-binding protein YhbY, partial [Eubacterium sp.]|nr:ribosome assembly RNA-binding protein YhbY [Eubacterium sp.]